MKKIIMVIVLMFPLLSLGEVTLASEGEGHVVSSPPLVYYLQWIILVIIFLLGLIYLLRLLRLGKPAQRRSILGGLFVLLITSYFSLGYHPSLEEYHEAPFLGFLKFILMAISGILVVFYGVLGRPTEEGHSASTKE